MNLHSPKPYSEYSKPLSGSNIEYFEDDYRSGENLFRRLRSLGVSLFTNGAGLGFDSPEGVITDELLSEMRAHRDDLIAVAERFEERAAVAQYDGGLIRSEAERLALSELPTAKQVVAPESSGCVVHHKRSAFDIYIGRPGPWGNPFEIGRDGSRVEVIEKYRAWIVKQDDLLTRLPELRGKILGCWCAPLPCHGDVLLELLNGLAVPVENPVMSISGVFCPFCRWDKFEELPHGDWRCRRCEKVAWRWLGESFVRVDVIGVDLSA